MAHWRQSTMCGVQAPLADGSIGVVSQVQMTRAMALNLTLFQRAESNAIKKTQAEAAGAKAFEEAQKATAYNEEAWDPATKKEKAAYKAAAEATQDGASAIGGLCVSSDVDLAPFFWRFTSLLASKIVSEDPELSKEVTSKVLSVLNEKTMEEKEKFFLRYKENANALPNEAKLSILHWVASSIEEGNVESVRCFEGTVFDWQQDENSDPEVAEAAQAVLDYLFAPGCGAAFLDAMTEFETLSMQPSDAAAQLDVPAGIAAPPEAAGRGPLVPKSSPDENAQPDQKAAGPTKPAVVVAKDRQQVGEVRD